jgi:glycine dehydrogenase
MLLSTGARSLEELVRETIPADLLSATEMAVPGAMTESSYLDHIRGIARENGIFRSYIGLGYYDCVTPAVILRNILENPSWYTQYTPYQAEISQGRLEALLNFQTVVSELTEMELANASLLDEATAAAEAMAMFHRLGGAKRERAAADGFFVSKRCFPQTIDVLKTRAKPLGIRIVEGEEEKISLDGSFFGALLQYPDAFGEVRDYSEFIESAHSHGIMVAVAADLMSLVMLTPPGRFGADAVVGTSQRFGVPVGYGGPHAAYFATRDEFRRQVPGRIIGVSLDRDENPAYRMALQTREQHIRRERATSNICTAQSLLAIMSSMYAVYHGPAGLRRISGRINTLARMLDLGFREMGLAQLNGAFFDTLLVDLSPCGKESFETLRAEALKRKINFRYLPDRKASISLDETVTEEDVAEILSLFSHSLGLGDESSVTADRARVVASVPESLLRKDDFLAQPVFNRYHSETLMLRYIKSLEGRDLSLAHSMIPLGSCTMKLNGTTEMVPISWEEFSRIHPFAPRDQAAGYAQVIGELEKYLCEITGLHACSLQPNSGAQGEYAGLMVIRKYFEERGETERRVVLIPSSAHGTNPASARMAGMDVVVVKCRKNGDVDIDDLRKCCRKNEGKVACLMVTYPSTHGVFEAGISEICDIIHSSGAQVYMDGANLNAQVGLCFPSLIGVDVCHINLHKTFSIPHGGGGPGMGPICVAPHLAPHLPGHAVVEGVGGEKPCGAISAAPWGSASILLISYGYIRLLGRDGMSEASRYAILNANYLKTRLGQHYDVLYEGENGRVAHEFMLDLRELGKSAGITVEDVAKRLMDYGFHAPTMSWPVTGTLMVEPTESESMEEMDRFCDAMIKIRGEIQEIIDGGADPSDNVLGNSPHTVLDLVSSDWEHPYSRQQAFFPLPYLRTNKFWPPVSRIDNAYGDRNLVCTCLPPEAYATEE